jgi:(methylthio)acryloyl-CoA hydratase
MTESLLDVRLDGSVAHLELRRATKRNALNDELIEALDAAFAGFNDEIRAVVLCAAGPHFCAGLDLEESSRRSPVDVLRTSQRWHQVFHRIQFSGRPVVAAMHGAVIGGGLELALAAHVRVAERDAFFQLPEAQRGIFVGGGASVRVARVIGPDRMTEMMLTGRRYDADDGYRLGLAHYLAETGEGRRMAAELAARIAENAPLSNWAVVNAVPRIHDMSTSDGLFAESLTVALTHGGDEARTRMREFLEGKHG